MITDLGTTKDGFRIRGFVHATADAAAPWVLLVHQLGKDHTEYNTFAAQVVHAGANALALDLRGHGDSVVRTSGKPRIDDHRSLTPHDWQRCYRDVLLALGFIAKRSPRCGMVGSSIGASAVLKAVPRVPALFATAPLVLLSPGLAYRGVDVRPAWRFLQQRGTQPVRVLQAQHDGPTVEFRQWVRAHGDAHTKFVTVPGAGHGLKLLADAAGQQRCNRLIRFLLRHLS
jgi:pimeloyl-ACP methyl ester carboxylesterase